MNKAQALFHLLGLTTITAWIVCVSIAMNKPAPEPIIVPVRPATVDTQAINKRIDEVSQRIGTVEQTLAGFDETDKQRTAKVDDSIAKLDEIKKEIKKSLDAEIEQWKRHREDGRKLFEKTKGLQEQLDAFMDRATNTLGPQTPKSEAEPPAEYVSWVYTMTDAERLSKEKQRPIFIAFATDPCPECKAVKQNSYENNEVAKRLCGNYVPLWCFVRDEPSSLPYKLAEDYRLEVEVDGEKKLQNLFPRCAVVRGEKSKVWKPSADPQAFLAELDNELWDQ